MVAKDALRAGGGGGRTGSASLVAGQTLDSSLVVLGRTGGNAGALASQEQKGTGAGGASVGVLTGLAVANAVDAVSVWSSVGGDWTGGHTSLRDLVSEVVVGALLAGCAVRALEAVSDAGQAGGRQSIGVEANSTVLRQDAESAHCIGSEVVAWEAGLALGHARAVETASGAVSAEQVGAH